MSRVKTNDHQSLLTGRNYLGRICILQQTDLRLYSRYFSICLRNLFTANIIKQSIEGKSEGEQLDTKRWLSQT